MQSLQSSVLIEIEFLSEHGFGPVVTAEVPNKTPRTPACASVRAARRFVTPCNAKQRASFCDSFPEILKSFTISFFHHPTPQLPCELIPLEFLWEKYGKPKLFFCVLGYSLASGKVPFFVSADSPPRTLKTLSFSLAGRILEAGDCNVLSRLFYTTPRPYRTVPALRQPMWGRTVRGQRHRRGERPGTTSLVPGVYHQLHCKIWILLTEE